MFTIFWNRYTLKKKHYLYIKIILSIILPKYLNSCFKKKNIKIDRAFRLRVLAELCKDMFAFFLNRYSVNEKKTSIFKDNSSNYDKIINRAFRFQVQAELRDLLLSCCTRERA